jgi:hypothetical protein
MASGLERGERLQIMLSREELNVVDDFRFKNRMPSRAAAIRDILRLGLSSLDVKSAPVGTKSQDVGVLTTPPKEPRAIHVVPGVGRTGK